MSKLQPNKSTTRGRVRALNISVPRRLFALALLFAVALCAFASITPSRAQSRRAPRPAATPTPEATPEATPQGESESQPRGASASAKDPSVVVSFSVLENDNAMMSLDYTAHDDIWKEFIDRLSKSRAVSVTQGGKATRGQARDRAKAEQDTYIVLFEMEDQSEMSGGGVGRTDSRTLVLKTYVYAPKTGSLKFADTIYQRPYRDTARIGGVPVPLPTGTHRMERYPSQLQLEQAARDAADRLLSRFNVILPPNN
jgi:hypothetical protein